MRKGILILFAANLVYAAANNETTRVPVLLELFTSEGCSSCPPADRLLDTLDQKQSVAGADLIVLSEHVDYWNHLGWKDPFSSAQYTARQHDYTERYKADGVYTPQLLVDGRYSLVGSDANAVVSAIRKALPEPKMTLAFVSVSREANEITARIELAADAHFKGVKAVLYVALADARQESQVSRGENAGHSLAHVAVARNLKQVDAADLDRASAGEIKLQAPPGSGASGLRIIAFVQDRKSGHIIGAAVHKL